MNQEKLEKLQQGITVFWPGTAVNVVAWTDKKYGGEVENLQSVLTEENWTLADDPVTRKILE